MEVEHHFELIRSELIPELNSTGRLYRHGPTGAELLSLENDDENKVFGINFRTTPSDSTGVAHIMEHSVLGGSRKYPVKEPFVELIKGSLNTFLNAFTYPDKTCYPVASQNLQDFYNLVDVYLDAVFFPLINRETFQQEGWHYELENPGAPLAYKGVVYNEMKGAYSEPEGVLDQQCLQAIFPDNLYHHDSGGDPTRIPDLTYEAFKRFHDTYYHPSNARFYFYGDDDPQKRLELLDNVLGGFVRLEVNSTIDLQPRYSQPRQVRAPYEATSAGDENGAKNLVAVNWLLPEAGDAGRTIGLEVLNHILTGTPASPLRKALIDSGLGEDLTGRGLESGSRQMFYSIGMKGVKGTDTEKVESLILETLSTLAQGGIDPETIAASLNTIEFSLRENNTGRYPRGLVVMLRALDHWLYDADPFSALRLDAPLAEVKSQVAAGEGYFEGLIRRYFLENLHRATVVLEPDPALAGRRAAAEQARLAAVRAALSPAELEAVAADTAALKRRQETPDSAEALATIPTLKLSDLDSSVRKIPSQETQAAETPILYHDLFTNGILYLDLGFNLHTLPQDWLPYIPLFGRALTEMGTQSETFVQLIQRIGRATGGIRVEPFVSAAPGRKEAESWLFLRSKAMVPQAGELLQILADILGGVRLNDRERFKQMALEEKASLESGLVRAGHRVVNTRLKAHFHEAGWVNEQTGGLSYVFFIRNLLAQIEQDWPSVLANLESIRDRLFNRRSLVANVTLDAGGWASVQPQLAEFIARLPAATSSPVAWAPGTLPSAEGFSIPSQVNFVGKAGSLFQAGYRFNGSMYAILQYLQSTWIHEKVRAQGGAYGGYAVFDPYAGVMSFLSYRDPNLESTLAIYDQTPGFLRQLVLDPAELVKSIIGAVGELDAYQLPDAKGYSALLRNLLGVSDEWRQARRDELLGASPADFKALVEALDTVSHNGQVAVLGSAEALQAARPGWLAVTKVL